MEEIQGRLCVGRVTASPIVTGWRQAVAATLLVVAPGVALATVALPPDPPPRPSSPPLPPGEKVLFQPGLPAGWHSQPKAPDATAKAPRQTSVERFAPASPLQADWEEALVVTIFLGQRLNPADALGLERKSKSENQGSRCQATPQEMYSDSQPANGNSAATNVVFCPDDGRGKGYLSIGKFIAGAVNYYAIHRIWGFPASSSVPIPLEEQRRWVNIVSSAVVCDNQSGSSPCTIRPGVSYMAITPRRLSAEPSSPVADQIMATLARNQAEASAPQGSPAPGVSRAPSVQATSLYGIPLDQASRTSLRRAIQESGLKAVTLDLIDGIDSYKPGPEMADARQLDIHYAPDGRFREADYLFPPEVSIERIGEMLKSRFGSPQSAVSAQGALRWAPIPALVVELRQGSGGVVLSFKRE